jgi:acyl-CoA thioesterase FadM
MNLIFRILYVLIQSLLRERLDAGNLVSRLSLRVLPSDIDINFRMNNGRYLTISDFNRVDLFARSGLLKSMFKRNWIPVIAEHTMNYKKPLGMFAHFGVLLEVTHWDAKYFYMKHIFSKGDHIIAEGTSKGCVHTCGHSVVNPTNAPAVVAQDKLK